MGLANLGLWADEEKKIRACLVAALEDLIAAAVVGPDDEEKVVSGKLRPWIIKRRKEHKLGWTLHPEASVFTGRTATIPSGHPDFQFSLPDPDGNQWDYDVECKLVRVKRPNKNWNYCKEYVVNGVQRFVSGKYGQNLPLGTMIGYVQEGELHELLLSVNQAANDASIPRLRIAYGWQSKSVTRLTHFLSRKTPRDFRLLHLWADLR